MHEHRNGFFLLMLVVAASFSLAALSCGASSTGVRQLEAVTLSPAAANATDYPDGQVAFVATGHYNAAPITVSPLAARWGTCYQGGSTTAISVTQAGIAQCALGAVGSYTVWADDPPLGISCNAITACGGGCFVAGTAQLTCGE